MSEAKIIDGKAFAAALRGRVAEAVAELEAVHDLTPGLAVVLVGENPASEVYVRNKNKQTVEAGMNSFEHKLSAETTQDELLALVGQLNADPKVHGILVQLPLPDGITDEAVINAVDPDKDVDGFHLYNLGALIAGGTVFPPCTPYGVQCLLEHMDIPIEGQNAVVVGRSNTVGKPMALMLLQKGATVSICTSKTRDLAQYTLLADILVVAVGKPRLITGPMVRKGATVIDVGINRLPDGKLVGDVDFDEVRKRAAHITPVPGGVGPMTITMLVANTVQAAERAAEKRVTAA